MTVDDENNIIDDEDEAKSAEQDNHHHHQPTCQNTIEHPPLPVISSEQQLPPTAAPAAEAVTGFCGVCKLVFSSESQLADHRLAYAQKIACCHCLKTFATMAKLRAHHRKHSKEKPFQCRSCGKYYTHRQSLARHQLLQHEGRDVLVVSGVDVGKITFYGLDMKRVSFQSLTVIPMITWKGSERKSVLICLRLWTLILW